MPDEENAYDAGSEPTSFELKFIECAHVVTVPLRVYPDPHAPKPRPAAPARYDTRDFFSRPVRVPGVCPACCNATKAVTKPAAKAKAATAGAIATSSSASVVSAAAAPASIAIPVDEAEPTPPP